MSGAVWCHIVIALGHIESWSVFHMKHGVQRIGRASLLREEVILSGHRHVRLPLPDARQNADSRNGRG